MINNIVKYWWVFVLIALIFVALAIWSFNFNKEVETKIEVAYQDAQNGKFFPIVKPLAIRSDSSGAGHYHASRSGGSRKHNGIDLLVQEGQIVYAPFDGTILRKAYPYANDKKWEGFVLKADSGNMELKVFYVLLTASVGNKVKKGTPIAKAQKISKKYSPSMKDHIHVEIWVNNTNIDPTQMVMG